MRLELQADCFAGVWGHTAYQRQILEDGDLYGDGVNIAARLEGLAAPGGILISGTAYDHLQGDRFRHATTFKRWRPDKAPADCRYEQLETTVPFELARIFGGG